MKPEELMKLIDQYGEACKQHGIAIGKEKGFINPAERSYILRQAIKQELGITEEDIPPYTLRPGI